MKYRNKYLILLIIIFLLLSQPFLISAIFFSPEISYIIKAGIMIVLGISSLSQSYKPKHTGSIVILGCLYIFLSFINHSERIVSLLLSIFDLIFFLELVILLHHDIDLRTKMLKFIEKFALFISFMIILSYFVYQYKRGVFSYSDDIAGYSGFYNLFLGIISDDKLRPCWYFAEPSYSGFFLGFCFLRALKKDYYNKKRKFFDLLLLLTGIIYTGSTGAYMYLIVALIVWIACKYKINASLLEIALFSSIFFILIAVPKIDTYGYLSLFIERSEASFLSRQNRLNIAKEVSNDMTLMDICVGKGPEYVTVKYKEGLSDAYNKMYCEFGVLFLIPFLLLVRKMTRKNFPVYCFSLLSYLSVIIFITPIVLLCYYSIYLEDGSDA